MSDPISIVAYQIGVSLILSLLHWDGSIVVGEQIHGPLHI